jgi:hypothetical protein
VRSEEGAPERRIERPRHRRRLFGFANDAPGSLAFSRDGRRLAYQRFADGGYRIWLSTLAGGTPGRYDGDSYQDGPTWSPDGEVATSTDRRTAWSLNKIRGHRHQSS